MSVYSPYSKHTIITGKYIFDIYQRSQNDYITPFMYTSILTISDGKVYLYCDGTHPHDDTLHQGYLITTDFYGKILRRELCDGDVPHISGGTLPKKRSIKTNTFRVGKNHRVTYEGNTIFLRKDGCLIMYLEDPQEYLSVDTRYSKIYFLSENSVLIENCGYVWSVVFIVFE